MQGYNTEWVNLKDKESRQEVESFLHEFDLILDSDVDYTIVIRNGTYVVATCSKAKNVLKCFAVSLELRGEGITSLLISTLIDKLFEQGIYHSFIFTKPSKVNIFSSLNFNLLYSNKDVALLESGIYNINKNLEEMKKKYDISDSEKAAIVMNCNPFTFGHKYLIEEASKNNKEVLVFIVEEDKSLFPFKIRYELALRGVEHLKNVKVLPGGEYIISSATFPSYFLRKEGEKLRAYVDLDASIFGKYLCKSFNITSRYVGEEPYCKVTKVYNEALKKVLPTYGVEVKEIPRYEFQHSAISASRVRALIREGNINDLKDFLPEVTLEFLNTSYGREIVEKIKVSNSPH